ncbi:hypothetical protein DAT35_00015 [Vitiosangium sp. GDMCC 1.1324]|nr:hypothetical protein DAT35_00015 [Vitiosangium sp. GDMCC 1.1324]
MFLMALACNPTASPDDSASGRAGNVLTERQPLQAAARTRQFGEDCTRAGRSECQTGLCLHYRPGSHEGYVCSDFCSDASECPSRWQCVTLVPGSPERVCTPPSDWAPSAVTKRGKGAARPRPTELPQSLPGNPRGDEPSP